ncbi:unnamed protein product, partial [Closterium sp. NIES-54]
IHGSKDSIKIKIKDGYTSPRQLSPAGGLHGLRELLAPSVRQTTKAAVGRVGTPTLLSSAVASAKNVGAVTKGPTARTLRVPLTELLRGGDVARTLLLLLLLALTAASAAPLRSSTPTTSTTPAPASTAATSATSATTTTAATTPASTAATSTPTPATTSTATPTPSAASTTTATAPPGPT